MHPIASVALSDTSIPLEYGSCRAYVNGESAGTLELPVFCTPAHAEQIAEHLALWTREFQSQPWFIGGLCTLLLGLICALSWLHRPHREVWIEFARERIVILDGFWLPGLFDGRNREHRSIREFSHVRVITTDIEGNGADSVRPAWLVSLEGPVHYASNTGVVQRQGGVELALLDAHGDALEYAARIATHLGLRILDTGRSWS